MTVVNKPNETDTFYAVCQIHFATFCYSPQLLNLFSITERAQSNFLTEEAVAL